MLIAPAPILGCLRSANDMQEWLGQVEVAAARGVAVAILGSIVWFGIDFSGRLGRIEAQLTILMQTVQEGRSRSERGEVPEFQPALRAGAGNASVQDARKRPGS